jgi:hypothetical protein
MSYTEYNAPFYEHFDNLFKTSMPRLDQMLLLQYFAWSCTKADESQPFWTVKLRRLTGIDTQFFPQ